MELTIIGILIILFIASLIWESKRAKIRDEESRVDFTAKWKAELEKPDYIVKFKISNGDVLETKPIGPSKFGKGISMLSHIVSSKDLAGRILDRDYEKGYFEDKDGNTYPACNIEKAWIEEA